MGLISDLAQFVVATEVAAEQADLTLDDIGDEMTAKIPNAERYNVLLIRGKNGKRFRIRGLLLEREK